MHNLPKISSKYGGARLGKTLKSVHQLHLAENQTFLLAPPSDQHRCIRVRFTQGVARLACSFGDVFPDITLAFCGDQEVKWLSLPFQNNFILEAMSASSLELEYVDQCEIEQDLIWEWLFDLHLVRHPVGAEARVAALLQLMVNRFGIRRADGYLLPFTLGHARMAELVGATRSTVTRQITLLRQQSDIKICESSGRFVLSSRVIEHMPTPRPRW